VLLVLKSLVKDRALMILIKYGIGFGNPAIHLLRIRATTKVAIKGYPCRHIAAFYFYHVLWLHTLHYRLV
jgi:hypothetical protein